MARILEARAIAGYTAADGRHVAFEGYVRLVLVVVGVTAAAALALAIGASLGESAM